MATIFIAPPAVPHEVTAEQVVSYLLAKEWRRLSAEDSPEWQSFMSPVGRRFVGWPSDASDVPHYLQATVIDIARAEGRHPSAVLAAIVGPARAASVDRECAVGMDGPWLWGGCDRLDGKCRDSAAREAGEESE